MEKLLGNLYLAFPVSNSASIQKIYKANPDKDEISITLKFYNKDNEILSSKTIRFRKNQLSKSQQKLFTNISYKEIENNYLYAKDEILSELIKNNMDTIRELQKYNEGMQSMMNHGFIQSVITPVTHPTEIQKKSNVYSDLM